MALVTRFFLIIGDRRSVVLRPVLDSNGEVVLYKAMDDAFAAVSRDAYDGIAMVRDIRVEDTDKTLTLSQLVYYGKRKGTVVDPLYRLDLPDNLPVFREAAVLSRLEKRKIRVRKGTGVK